MLLREGYGRPQICFTEVGERTRCIQRKSHREVPSTRLIKQSVGLWASKIPVDECSRLLHHYLPGQEAGWIVCETRIVVKKIDALV